MDKDGKGGAWTAHPLPMNGETAGDFHFLGVKDFDGDGDIDVFSGESEWNANRARWFVWENMDGKGMTFQRRTILDNLGAHNAIVADMDGDMDLVNKEFDPQPWNLLQDGQHADLVENQSTHPGGSGLARAAAGPRHLRLVGVAGGLEVESTIPGQHSVELRDVKGNLLASRAMRGPSQCFFSAEGVAPGVYWIRAKTGTSAYAIRAVLNP